MRHQLRSWALRNPKWGAALYTALTLLGVGLFVGAIAVFGPLVLIVLFGAIFLWLLWLLYYVNLGGY